MEWHKKIMQLTIHRGAKEIGGSCVEINAGSSRIIADIGIPLHDVDGSDFSDRSIDFKDIPGLIKKKILPDVKGLYFDEGTNIDGILISHPHKDHYGFLGCVRAGIPFYMSRGCAEMIKAAHFFGQTNVELQDVKLVRSWKNPFKVGDFVVTPYLVDHSGFDARAFLIEADGKKIFYSGDIRGHGKKSKVYEYLLKHPPKNVDCLLLEGTNINNKDKACDTEDSIENELKGIFAKKQGLAIISFSSQNIDRLVSVVRACKRTNKIFVIDPYTAYILEKCKEVGPGIPQHDWKNIIRVFYSPGSHTKKLIKTKDAFRYKSSKITYQEIIERKKDIVLKDNYFNRDYFIGTHKLDDTVFIYSQWRGYLEKDKKQKEFWARHNIKPLFVHTSGHAVLSDLQKLADAINPKEIIPIHTFAAESYAGIFKQPVRKVKDGETIEV